MTNTKQNSNKMVAVPHSKVPRDHKKKKKKRGPPPKQRSGHPGGGKTRKRGGTLGYKTKQPREQPLTPKHTQGESPNGLAPPNRPHKNPEPRGGKQKEVSTKIFKARERGLGRTQKNRTGLLGGGRGASAPVASGMLKKGKKGQGGKKAGGN